MKTFKTFEEIVEYINDKENIDTLDNGEMTLRDWVEDHKALEKYKKDYGLATNDKKSLRTQKEELARQIAELTEQRDAAINELEGLKKMATGGDERRRAV